MQYRCYITLLPKSQKSRLYLLLNEKIVLEKREREREKKQEINVTNVPFLIEYGM